MNCDKIDSLTKPYWQLQDIMNYLNCSRNTAVEIKFNVINKYGCTIHTADSGKKSVRGDDVIKYLGGNSRIEELQIELLKNQIKGEK